MKLTSMLQPRCQASIRASLAATIFGVSVTIEPVLLARTRITPSAAQIFEQLVRSSSTDTKGFAKSAITGAQDTIKHPG
jgi:hypothetical protein